MPKKNYTKYLGEKTREKKNEKKKREKKLEKKRKKGALVRKSRYKIDNHAVYLPLL